MKIIRTIYLWYQTLRFKLLNLATIKDLPTDQFNRLIGALVDSGWVKTFEYDGFDAWIDYGRIKLTKEKLHLTFEWDNWTEGSIEGPRFLIDKIGLENDWQVVYQWRWI